MLTLALGETKAETNRGGVVAFVDVVVVDVVDVVVGADTIETQLTDSRVRISFAFRLV